LTPRRRLRRVISSLEDAADDAALATDPVGAVGRAMGAHAGGVRVFRLLRTLAWRMTESDRTGVKAAIGAAGVVTGVVMTAAGVLPQVLAMEELVSVVVCTLGREPRLRGTARAVLEQTHRNLEFVVVDNDPASGRTSGLLADIHDPRLRVVTQPVPGLSAARNAGLEAARGRLVAYTDDDAVPEETWVERLVEVIGADTSGTVTCVTGRVVAAETGTSEQQWFEEFGDFDKGVERTVWSLGSHMDEVKGTLGERSAFFPYTAGEMGSGNNMLFRTDALRELGGFDEALGAGSPTRGGEDLDIYRRVILAGQTLVYTPDAVVRHHHRDNADALRRQMFGYGAGMAASLTKVLLQGGRPALALLRRLPRGVHMLLSPSSEKNEKFPEDTSRSLVGAELLGYLAGPLLYVRSVLQVHRRLRAARRACRPEVRSGS
jgi:glycosyltransferase involved in cell wall biosynthesis